MIKITNLKETEIIKPIMLRAYIAKKITALIEEYSVDTFDDIGCFVVLDEDEFTEFPMNEMEFVEVLEIGKLPKTIMFLLLVTISLVEIIA